MIAHYYTLVHLVRNMAATLPGRQLEEVFSQTKHELVLTWGAASEPDSVADVNRSLVISCVPSLNYILPRRHVSRARRNSIDFFPTAIGLSLRTVALHSHDRQISFHFDNGHRIVVQLFRSSANVFCLNERSDILGSFLQPKVHTGNHFEDPPRSATTQFHDAETFLEHISRFADYTINDALKALNPLLGPLIISEVCYRAGIERYAPTGSTPPASIRRVFETSKAVTEELSSRPAPRIYAAASQKPLFSLVPMQHLGNASSEMFVTIEEGIRQFLRTSRGRSELHTKKHRILSLVRQKLERTSRALEKAVRSSKPDEYSTEFETRGKLILANLGRLSKGQTTVCLEDFTSPGKEPVEVALDPSKTPAENAEMYFQKGKKAKASAAGRHERIALLEKQNHRLQTLFSSIDEIESREQLEEFLTRHVKDFREAGLRMPTHQEQKQERPPFRIFTVAGGFQVWVGRNSQNNDLLTMKHSSSNDLWFHVRGSGGSHVVLKVGTSKGEPGKEAIHQAASIAAFYSKMKKAKVIPVAMTLKKFVRKPRGAPAGTVTIEREKVLFVEASLPESESQTED